MLRYYRIRWYRIRGCVHCALTCLGGSSRRNVDHGIQIRGHLLLGEVDESSLGASCIGHEVTGPSENLFDLFIAHRFFGGG